MYVYLLKFAIDLLPIKMHWLLKDTAAILINS